jgi:methionyl-tRNA formyltransferase
VRTVYLGTSDFAAAVLRRLAASEHRPALVVTRPDRPAGRGRSLRPPPVAPVAAELGIELFQPESVNGDDARARIAAAAPDALVVCAFGALIREGLLADHEIINVHPSLLPRWRGAAPVERAIMAGDDETGVAIMRMTAGLDSGPVGLVEREPIGPEDTYGTLARRLQELGGDLLVRALDERPDWREQDEDGVTYAEKIGPEDRTLDPAEGAPAAARRVRALTPHIGARLALPDGGWLGVRAARPAPAELSAPGAGELAEGDGRLLWGTGGEALELLEVQPPGGRAMDAASYLRGHVPRAL